jgi:tetratricopeptide (TPR) repeat protein
VNLKIIKYPVLTLWLLAFAHNCLADDARFRAGVAAYEAGQFEPAGQDFRDSLAKETASGTLLNLGLAEWQQGRTGEAILVWEQAAWLDPFNRATRQNLLYARETTQVNPLELTWFEQCSTLLPANGWMWIASGSLWVAVALVTLPNFFRIRKAGWHQTMGALALGVFLFSLAPSAGIFTRSNIGIVMKKNTRLRLTPTHAAEAVADLSAGEPVRELREHGDYLFVHTQNGNGWVERAQIGFLVPKVK